MPHPAYEPSELPPGDAIFAGQDQHGAAAEMLTLTWEFFTQASPGQAWRSSMGLWTDLAHVLLAATSGDSACWRSIPRAGV